MRGKIIEKNGMTSPMYLFIVQARQPKLVGGKSVAKLSKIC